MTTDTPRNLRLLRRPLDVRTQLLVLILCIVTGLPAWGQFRKRRGNGRGNLPGALARLPRSQMGTLDQLLGDAIAFFQKRLPESASEPGNFFGSVVLRPPAEDAVDAKPIVPGQFGYYVLGAFSSDQFLQLRELGRSQTESLATHKKHFAAVLKKTAEILELERPSRASERELQTLGREMGASDVAMGLARAKAFIEIGKSLNKDQREYLSLLRKAPDSGSMDNPNVVKVFNLMARMDDASRLRLLTLAEQCCLYLTGSASQNVPTLGRRSMTDQDSEEADRKMGLIQAMNPNQQNGLATLVASYATADRNTGAKRLQIALMLDNLKNNRRVDEKTLVQPGAALGQAEATAISGKIRGLRQLSDSFSNAQRTFIADNILAGARP